MRTSKPKKSESTFWSSSRRVRTKRMSLVCGHTGRKAIPCSIRSLRSLTNRRHDINTELAALHSVCAVCCMGVPWRLTIRSGGPLRCRLSTGHMALHCSADSRSIPAVYAPMSHRPRRAALSLTDAKFHPRSAVPLQRRGPPLRCGDLRAGQESRARGIGCVRRARHGRRSGRLPRIER